MKWSNPAERDIYFMRHALDAARHAYELGEVPVGAIVVCNDEIIAQGFNQPIGLCDSTAHAEVLALRAAGLAVRNYRLPDCELFVTLEPCLMCAGAMIYARISRVVYGASDFKTGVVDSVLQVFSNEHLNHHTNAIGGILADEAKTLLQQFFRERRKGVHAQIAG